MITGKNLIKTAMAELPEFKEEYEKQIAEDIIDDETGLHIVFEYAFDPLVIEAVQSKDTEKCKRFFDFIEKMAESRDDDVMEVTDFSVMERLIGDIGKAELVKHLGKYSMESFEQVGQYMF